jgi:hypothetical protein
MSGEREHDERGHSEVSADFLVGIAPQLDPGSTVGAKSAPEYSVTRVGLKVQAPQNLHEWGELRHKMARDLRSNENH